jgi:hypothetical protein
VHLIRITDSCPCTQVRQPCRGGGALPGVFS